LKRKSNLTAECDRELVCMSSFFVQRFKHVNVMSINQLHYSSVPMKMAVPYGDLYQGLTNPTSIGKLANHRCKNKEENMIVCPVNIPVTPCRSLQYLLRRYICNE
jgi:hypothetical protein